MNESLEVKLPSDGIVAEGGGVAKVELAEFRKAICSGQDFLGEPSVRDYIVKVDIS